MIQNKSIKNIDFIDMSPKFVPQVHSISVHFFNDSWSEKNFYEELENMLAKTILGVYNNDIVVGFINVRLIVDEVMINNIAVVEEFSNQGIGTKLLEEVSNYAKSKFFKKMTLEVRQSNTNAINFYIKNGFVVDGERKNFYAKPTETAILMSKSL